MMGEHEDIRALLEPFALGELTAREADEVRAHLETCSDCRAHVDALKVILDCTAWSAESVADEAAAQDARDRLLEGVETERRGRTTLPLWRRIMSKRIFRVGTAAAAAVIFFVVMFWPGVPMTGKVYGITDIPGMLRSAKSLHMKGSSFMPVTLPDGKQEQKKMPVEFLGDLENHRYRLLSSCSNMGPKGPEVRVTGVVSDGEYEMAIDPASKSVTFSRLSHFHNLVRMRLISDTFLRFLYHPEGLAGFKKIGQETVKGEAFDRWQGEFGDPFRIRLEIVLSPTSGDLERVRGWIGQGGSWSPILELDQFDLNAVIPSETFRTEPPAGYVSKNTKATAAPVELTGSGAEFNNVRVRGYISLILPDGSVICGWSSTEGSPPGSQEELFKGLTVGGPLPKLPVEIYAMKPMASQDKSLLEGRHLGYTRKGNTFYEWGIYVPGAARPGSVDLIGHQAIYRFNPADRKMDWKFIVMPKPEVMVECREDFDGLVLGAMAEFSDAGTAVEGITWEDVMKLTETIRASMKRGK